MHLNYFDLVGLRAIKTVFRMVSTVIGVIMDDVCWRRNMTADYRNEPIVT